jgi:hypothetical protein
MLTESDCADDMEVKICGETYDLARDYAADREVIIVWVQ